MAATGAAPKDAKASAAEDTPVAAAIPAVARFAKWCNRGPVPREIPMGSYGLVKVFT